MGGGFGTYHGRDFPEVRDSHQSIRGLRKLKPMAAPDAKNHIAEWSQILKLAERDVAADHLFVRLDVDSLVFVEIHTTI